GADWQPSTSEGRLLSEITHQEGAHKSDLEIHASGEPLRLRMVRERYVLFLVCSGFVIAILSMSADRMFADPDIYWHLTVGQRIIENRTFPQVDELSHTFAGAPWIAKEWLSQV